MFLFIGGATVTIQGTGFGTGAVIVTVGGTSCADAVITDTNITCTLPSLPPALQLLHVMVPTKGLAVKQ